MDAIYRNDLVVAAVTTAAAVLCVFDIARSKRTTMVSLECLIRYKLNANGFIRNFTQNVCFFTTLKYTWDIPYMINLLYACFAAPCAYIGFRLFFRSLARSFTHFQLHLNAIKPFPVSSNTCADGDIPTIVANKSNSPPYQYIIPSIKRKSIMQHQKLIQYISKVSLNAAVIEEEEEHSSMISQSFQHSYCWFAFFT